MNLAFLSTKIDQTLTSTAAGATIFTFKRLLTAVPDAASPYLEAATPDYEPVGTAIVGWVKLMPAGPRLPSAQSAQMRMGESRNVSAWFYVSRLENERKKLLLDVDATNIRAEFGGNVYDILSVEPRSHVAGVPLYFKLPAERVT